jgi:hypothetical protein
VKTARLGARAQRPCCRVNTEGCGHSLAYCRRYYHASGVMPDWGARSLDDSVLVELGGLGILIRAAMR